jgi:hypothetical protein
MAFCGSFYRTPPVVLCMRHGLRGQKGGLLHSHQRHRYNMISNNHHYLSGACGLLLAVSRQCWRPRNHPAAASLGVSNGGQGGSFTKKSPPMIAASVLWTMCLLAQCCLTLYVTPWLELPSCALSPHLMMVGYVKLM